MTQSNLFKALCDETRLRCLMLMAREGRLCVCELCHATTLSQPKISRHLASLRNQGLVTDTRQGQWVFYELNTDLPAWEKEVLSATARGLHDKEPFVSDENRLNTMTSRPQRCCAA